MRKKLALALGFAAAAAGGAAGAALGAARLGALADGLAEEQVCPRLAVARRFEANPERHGVLAQRHARYQTLYSQLRPVFAQPHFEPRG